ncbi:MAG: tetratricopeptide repeat protein, partial [Chthoniobacterales bacterium]
MTAIDAEARNLLGRARDAARSDRNGEAAELFGKALQLEPKYRHEVIREYADQLTYSGKAAEAVPLYREAVAEEKITKQEKRKAQLGLGLALSWSKQHDESLLVYEQLLKINNKDFDARVGKARALAVADRNAEAVKAYEAMIAQLPKRRTEVLREYAEQLTYSKRLPAAITTFREIIRDNPVSTKEGRLARLGLGLALAWDKQLDAALSVYDQLLEHNPRDAEAEMGRARGLSAAGRNAEAAALFKSIVEKYPEKRRQLLKEAADQMTYAHEFEGAFSVYRELLKDDSLDARARVELQNSYGLALSWNEQWDQALQQYDAALAADSKNITARLGRARVLAALKRQGEAKREYERVLKQDPRNAEALRGLGRLQSWRGRQRDAQAQLRDVLHEHPDDAEAAFWLAQAQSWMGRPDAAEATLHKLLELHPRHQVSRQLLEDLEWRERPQSDLSFQYSTQSDDLEIFTTRFQQDFFLRDGAMMLGPRFDWIFYQHAQQPRIEGGKFFPVPGSPPTMRKFDVAVLGHLS